jgi:hypothetical protein
MQVKDAFEMSGSSFGGILDSTDFICGCEFEIEDIKQNIDHPMILRVEDHSLRNNGWEYKTKPSDFKTTLELFAYLHKHLKLGNQAFSHRTSTHVHVNVRNMELSTVRQLVLSYALLEPLFFKFVGPEREHNIFCVPLSFTTLPNNYKKDIKYLHGTWHKYTAFNILPLGLGKNSEQGLGTIEFRHLFGTKDPVIFKDWLSILKELYDWFQKNPDYEIIAQLAKGVPVTTIAHQIVPTLAQKYTSKEIQDACKDSALDVKLSIGGLAK